METEFRFGLKQRLYNRNMRLARERLGYSQKLLADLIGVSFNLINGCECLRNFPCLETAKRIADVLEVPLESIFPLWLRKLKIGYYPATIEERSISLEELASKKRFRLSSDSSIEDLSFKNLDQDSFRHCLNEALGTLSSRHREILELRFGLKSGKPMTLVEISKIFGVSPERIRGIQVKALKDLRHPERSQKLREFLSV